MSSSGSRFGQLQLEKYGWKEGKGLGREEGGITKALKPKLKFDSAGFGHDRAQEYKFHWWDHAFNKAAENIEVKKVQDGSVQLLRKEELHIGKKKPSLVDNKAKFYGTFVKGGTLVGEKEEKGNSESEESEDERDMSLTLTDEELFKICGERTAHKGARHGLTMSAKLARVAEQDRLLMENWTNSPKHLKQEPCKSETIEKNKKKKRKDKKVDVSETNLKQMDIEEPKKKKVKSTVNEEPFLSTKDIEENIENCKRKTSKKHTQNVIISPLEFVENGSLDNSYSEDLLVGDVQKTHVPNNEVYKNSSKIKNNKRKNETTVVGDVGEQAANDTEGPVEEVKKKKKRKNKTATSLDASECPVNGTEGKGEEKTEKSLDEKENKFAEGIALIGNIKKKKKKEIETVDFHSESVIDESRKKKKHKYADRDERQQMEDHELPDVPCRKKKKKKGEFNHK